MNKKYLTDMGPHSRSKKFVSIEFEDSKRLDELIIDDDEEEEERLQREQDDETTSVFDLVHRGRQRD